MKKIKGFNYAVDKYGNIFNLKTGRKLKPYPDGSGYLMIGLSKNGKRTIAKVAKLVAHYFIGPKPKGKEINHKDGIKKNNHWKNLEYVTHSENLKHAYKNKLIRRKKNNCGEMSGTARLKNADIRKIRRLYNTDKYTQREIGNMFGVCQQQIHRIISKKRWSHVA